MRQLLFERQIHAWQDTRTQGKLARRAETDVIQQLVEYARAQGSQNSGKLFWVYTKLANRTIGITSREVASAAELSQLDVIETITLRCVAAGMRDGKHYSTIYQDCKQRLLAYQEIAFLGPAAGSKQYALSAIFRM